jgi:hypothetical protein
MTENNSTGSVQAERGDRFMVRNIQLGQQLPGEFGENLHTAIESLNKVIDELRKYEATLFLINSGAGFTDYNIIENNSTESVQAERGDRFLVRNIRLGQQTREELQSVARSRAPVEFRRRLHAAFESFNQVIDKLQEQGIALFFSNTIGVTFICPTILHSKCDANSSWVIEPMSKVGGPCAKDHGEACCEKASLSGDKYNKWMEIREG